MATKKIASLKTTFIITTTQHVGEGISSDLDETEEFPTLKAALIEVKRLLNDDPSLDATTFEILEVVSRYRINTKMQVTTRKLLT